MDKTPTAYVGSTRRIRLANLRDINQTPITNLNIGTGTVTWRMIDQDNLIVDSGTGTYNAQYGWIASIVVPDSPPWITIEWEVTRPPEETEYFRTALRVEHRHG